MVFGNFQFLRHGFHRCRRVSGGDDDADAARLQVRKSPARVVADFVRQGERPRRLSVQRGKNGHAALPALFIHPRGQGGNVHALFLHHVPGTQGYLAALDGSGHTPSGEGLEVRNGVQGEFFIPRSLDEGARNGMFAALFQGGALGKQLVHVHAACRGDVDEGGPAFREGPGFIHDQGVHLVHGFQGSRVPEQDAQGGRLSGGHHHGHGGSQSQCARACHNQDGHGVHQPVRPARLRSPESPDEECEYGDRRHGKDKITRHLVRQPLHGGLCPLGLGHQADDACQHGAVPHFPGRHGEGARGVQRGADQGVSGNVGDGNGFSREHGFVHIAPSVLQDAVHGNLFSRFHPQHVAGLDFFQGNVALHAVGQHEVRRGGGQVHQRPDGFRRAGPGLQFQDLPEQAQGDDDGRRFIIHGYVAVADEDLRKPSGHDRSRQTVQEGDGSSGSDQRPHIGIARFNGFPATDQQRLARPQDYGGGQQQFHPVLHPRIQPCGDVAAHGNGKEHDHQREGNVEAPAEVVQFPVVLRGGGRKNGFKRHAADGARTGMVLPDLGMHGAGVNGAGRGRAWVRRGRGGGRHVHSLHIHVPVG